ncbi:MAG TPA: long-chain fatty acid--CoA ligase, partial [Desulfarculaceae bacterium]|nr:long-chain fatty acid--CoA ligase [Desulfarculaceae bacterium]
MAELSGKTLCQAFLDMAARRSDQVALREKEFGIWQSITWQQYREHVTYFALGLKAVGFERGNHLAIISENCREWIYAELGTIALGGVTIGVYPTSPATEVQYVVNHADARFVVCEDQEQTDKILEVWDELPRLQKIIVIDMKGLRNYPQENIISFKELEVLGRKLAAENLGLFASEVAQGRPEDVCIMIYTSGTTGKPKGAMINHENIEATTLSKIGRAS